MTRYRKNRSRPLTRLGGKASWANQVAPVSSGQLLPPIHYGRMLPPQNHETNTTRLLYIPDRPAEGAWAEATDRGPTVYLNGFIDNGSPSDYAHFTNLRRYPDGPIVPNTTLQAATILSTPSLDNYPRAMGGLPTSRSSAQKAC